MNIDIHSGPAFAFGEITLPPDGAVRVEAGAMAMTRGDVSMTTSTQGGFLKGLRRSLGGESFYVNDFTSRSGGIVGVAAPLPGDIVQVELQAAMPVMVQSGSWLASDTGIDVDTKWGGSKTFFSGEGLLLLRCSGQGGMALSSYGAIRPTALAAGEALTLDTGHVVAFDSSVTFTIRKSGGWKSTILGGEGVVTDLTGPGRVWWQTRNSSELVSWLDAKLPRRDNSNT